MEDYKHVHLGSGSDVRDVADELQDTTIIDVTVDSPWHADGPTLKLTLGNGRTMSIAAGGYPEGGSFLSITFENTMATVKS